ncbi:hypothetical protein QR680_009229 [Steinernema hermaphroditum]|uniref:Transcription factor CBF/NF-Y/archaeal histone domain-containing protein n=1 Tax=Steinernema hermaphroditum TaxID=289476 RepID=A0AA39IJH4_9BILA|nr:hypothetical protein QR680_009229 [Steinernema hermaphroditum]
METPMEAFNVVCSGRPIVAWSVVYIWNERHPVRAEINVCISVRHLLYYLGPEPISLRCTKQHLLEFLSSPSFGNAAKLDSPRATKRRADMEHVTAQLRDFWPSQQSKIDSLDYPTLREINKHQELPLARIKKIMRIDEDVRAHMISSEVPVLLAKAAEIFIEELTLRAWYHTEESKRKTIQRSDISTACARCDMFDFLIDIVPREDAMKPSRPPMESVTYVEPENPVQHVIPQPSQESIVYLSCPPSGFTGEQVLQIDNGHGQILQATQIGPSIPLSTTAGAQGHTIQIVGVPGSSFTFAAPGTVHHQ